VRVEPEHCERFAPPRAVARDSGNGADRDAMIAAHDDRDLAGCEAFVDGVVHGAAPSRNFA